MCGEGFDAKCFGRVMAAENKIASKFLRGDRSPMLRFAGDECVDLVRGNAISFGAAGAGDDADPGCFFRSEIEGLDRSAQNSAELADQFCSRQRLFDSQSNQLPFLFEERLRRFESKSSSKLRVIAYIGVNVERQMRAVERDVVFKSDFQLPTQTAGNWLQSWPQQTVMHNQKVDLLFSGLG